MKNKFLLSAILVLGMLSLFQAQPFTKVNATNNEVSDNLDLRAVASIFGQSANLEDFERRINNPRAQISNLDLNQDGNVDYLRVIEDVNNNSHIVIIQSVLGADIFQDIATMEVQRDFNNQVQMQVVGDHFIYGPNFIYEPIFVSRPVIFNTFWVGNYRPYFSRYHWNYYPTYFSFWNPYPVFRYRRNVNIFINSNNSYHYVANRRCLPAYYNYQSRRANGYELRNENQSFTQRNRNVTNYYELNSARNKTVNNDRQRITYQDNSNRNVNRRSNSADASNNSMYAGANRSTQNNRIESTSARNSDGSRSNQRRTSSNDYENRGNTASESRSARSANEINATRSKGNNHNATVSRSENEQRGRRRG